MNLDALFDNLLTSGIKLSNLETIRKVKIFNIFHLGVIVLAPLAGVFYFYIGAVSLFYASFIAALLTISSLLVVRKTRNLALGGNYAILILWATLLYEHNGRPDSPPKIPRQQDGKQDKPCIQGP